MRLLVSGGRFYSSKRYAWRCLDAIHTAYEISLVIHGCVTGADTIADHWAIERLVPTLRFPVKEENWERIGPRAGVLRNQRMIDLGKPDFGLLFPGNNGTANMKARLVASGIKFYEVKN